MGSRNRSILTIAIAFVVGLILGWVVLGWWLFPVQWTGALLQDLQPADKKLVIETEAEAYALTQDNGQAVERLSALGTQQEVAELSAEVVQEATASGDVLTADRVKQMAANIGLVLPDLTASVAPTPAASAEQEEEKGGSMLPTLLGLLLLAGGIALAAWLLLRRRSPEADASEPAAPAAGYAATTAASPDLSGANRPQPVAAGYGGDQAIVHEFTPTFHQGDIEYDQSYDIDAADGSYLGECGLTMSELVGGDPNRVTALEVWLFDKSDIRTVTKVLMTDFAYGNQALRDKLSSKGDALLLSPDMGFVLDAQTLRLMGKVVAIEYDDTAAPPRSTLRRLSLELTVMKK